MPRTKGQSAEIRCYITHEARDTFVKHFPTKHSFSWVLQTAIDSINALVDGTPTTEETIRSAIKQSVLQHRLQLKQQRLDDNATESTTANTVSRPSPKPTAI